MAAPAYLSKRPAPTEPQDLGRHDVLVYSSVHGDDQLHFTHPRRERASVRVRGPFRCNNLSSLLAAARDGFGIAALPMYVAGESLARGELEQLLTGYTLPSQEIHAVFPSPKLVPSKVTTFVEHLKAHFASPDWYVAAAPAAKRAPRRALRRPGPG